MYGAFTHDNGKIDMKRKADFINNIKNSRSMIGLMMVCHKK